MNFTEICKLFAERGGDRQAIADALHMTVEQIDLLQIQAMEIARQLTPINRTPGSSRRD